MRFVPTNYDDRRLAEGDVLFNNTNSPELIGKSAYIGRENSGLAFSNHMTRIQFLPVLDPRFAAIQLHYLWSMKYFLHRCVKHVNQASVSSTDLAKSVPIVVPPLNEQKRIVAKIEELSSELDKGIESLKFAREQLKVYRQTILKHAFEGKLTIHWRDLNKDRLESVKQLLTRIKSERELCYQQRLEDWQKAIKECEKSKSVEDKPSKPKKPLEGALVPNNEMLDLPEKWEAIRFVDLIAYQENAIKRGPFGSSIKKSFFVPSGYKIYEQQNAINDDVSLGRYYINQAKFHELEAFSVKGGDYLVSCSGTIGKITRLPPDCAPGVINQALLKLVIDDNLIDHRYFINLFRSEFFQRQILKGTRGSGMQNLASVDEIKDIIIKLPPKTEQLVIVKELEQKLSVCESLEIEIETSLQQSEAMRQSILKKAFSGRLITQDPIDEPASVLLERIRAEKEAQVMENQKPKAKRNAA